MTPGPHKCLQLHLENHFFTQKLKEEKAFSDWIVHSLPQHPSNQAKAPTHLDSITLCIEYHFSQTNLKL
jgi:hypothetical protein